jgi:hypothetical protein
LPDLAPAGHRRFGILEPPFVGRAERLKMFVVALQKLVTLHFDAGEASIPPNILVNCSIGSPGQSSAMDLVRPIT